MLHVTRSYSSIIQYNTSMHACMHACIRIYARTHEVPIIRYTWKYIHVHAHHTHGCTYTEESIQADFLYNGDAPTATLHGKRILTYINTHTHTHTYIPKLINKHMHTYLLRDIEPGEQLCFSYSGDTSTAALYTGFADGQCRCYACLRTRGGDSHVEKIMRHARRFAMYKPARENDGKPF